MVGHVTLALLRVLVLPALPGSETAATRNTATLATLVLMAIRLQHADALCQQLALLGLRVGFSITIYLGCVGDACCTAPEHQQSEPLIGGGVSVGPQTRKIAAKV